MFSNQRFASLSHGQSPASRLVLATAFFVAISALTSTGQAADFGLTGSQHLDVTSVYSTGILWDSSTVDVLPVGSIDGAYVEDNASLRLHGGSIHWLNAYDTSSVDMSGGTISSLRSRGASTVDMSGGNIDGYLYANDTTTVDISGGSVKNLDAYDTSSVNMSGGSIANGLYAHDTTTVDISGGSVGRLTAYGATTVNISDGSISSLFSDDTSTVDISGGSIANGLYAHDSSVTFHGYDFHTTTDALRLDGQRVLGMGVLTGKWFDDTPWAVNIVSNPPSATIRAVVPEPSTFTLAAFGLLGLLAWGRRRKGAVSPRA